MVKRFLSFVGREISGLHEAAYLLAASAVASLFFALVRDRLLASAFGASASLDVYYAAFRVPDFIYIAVASLVSTSILVPFLVESRQKGGDDLRRTINDLFSAFLILVLASCAAAFVFMEPIMKSLFPNLFAMGMGEELVSVSRILLLSPILLGLSSFFASITQIQNRFLVYALSSSLYNVGIIVGILFFMPHLGIRGIAFGVGLGAALLGLVQVPYVVKDGLFPRVVRGFDWQRVKRVALLSVPRTVTLSSQQLTTLAFVSVASFLGPGSISIFTFALNLQSVPLSIIGASYSSAAFPVLAKLVAQGDRAAFLEKMVAAARHIIFWSVPLTMLFIVLRAQIVRTALGAGEFSWSDTRLTAAALALFIVSSTAQGLMLLFVRSFYAEGKTAKPLALNVASMGVTVALAFALVSAFHSFPEFRYFIESLLRAEGSDDTSVLMLPLAFSIGALFNLALHWRAFSKEFSGFTAPLVASAFRSVSASIIGGYVAYGSLRLFDDVYDLATAVGIFLQGLSAGVIGIAVIAIVLWLLRSPELADIGAALKRRVWRVDRASLDRLQS